MFVFSAVSSIVFGSNVKISDEKKKISSSYLDGGPMDSPWPMYCHDIHHTGRSPYSTSSNYGFEKWWFKTNNSVEGSAAIDKNNILYFGSFSGLYAVDLINRSYLSSSR
jgi:hypothetical protein